MSATAAQGQALGTIKETPSMDRVCGDLMKSIASAEDEAMRLINAVDRLDSPPPSPVPEGADKHPEQNTALHRLHQALIRIQEHSARLHRLAERLESIV